MHATKRSATTASFPEIQMAILDRLSQQADRLAAAPQPRKTRRVLRWTRLLPW
ncbi:hypothetical protein [Loktanella sp. R86503]|uniref:hypothetical protein n=1 Tax=Loktanella TaxID=245186 RepID=UPI0036DEFC9B